MPDNSAEALKALVDYVQDHASPVSGLTALDEAPVNMEHAQIALRGEPDKATLRGLIENVVKARQVAAAQNEPAIEAMDNTPAVRLQHTTTADAVKKWGPQVRRSLTVSRRAAAQEFQHEQVTDPLAKPMGFEDLGGWIGDQGDALCLMALMEKTGLAWITRPSDIGDVPLGFATMDGLLFVNPLKEGQKPPLRGAALKAWQREKAEARGEINLNNTPLCQALDLSIKARLVQMGMDDRDVDRVEFSLDKNHWLGGKYRLTMYYSGTLPDALIEFDRALVASATPRREAFVVRSTKGDYLGKSDAYKDERIETFAAADSIESLINGFKPVLGEYAIKDASKFSEQDESPPSAAKGR